MILSSVCAFSRLRQVVVPHVQLVFFSFCVCVLRARVPTQEQVCDPKPNAETAVMKAANCSAMSVPGWKTKFPRACSSQSGLGARRYAHEKDPGSLAQALFDEKMKANLHRPHPNFPDKEDSRRDMIQVKVFDTEEELSESEDELAVEGRLEASDSEEGLEDEDPEQADTPGDDKSSRKRTPKAKAKRRAKAKAKGSANKQRRGHEAS
eukprot:Skav236119  [mRNA]  locus=scaffold5992:8928:15908:+ [translate_table: standard]